MPVKEMEPRWRQRLAQIESRVDEVRLPQGAQDLSQDAEWCEAVIAGQPQRFRLHDYNEIYRVPGLYEELFYHKLECCSPTRTANLLVDLLADSGEDLSDCVVMDLGAGNGMVADELYCRGGARDCRRGHHPGWDRHEKHRRFRHGDGRQLYAAQGCVEFAS